MVLKIEVFFFFIYKCCWIFHKFLDLLFIVRVVLNRFSILLLFTLRHMKTFSFFWILIMHNLKRLWFWMVQAMSKHGRVKNLRLVRHIGKYISMFMLISFYLKTCCLLSVLHILNYQPKCKWFYMILTVFLKIMMDVWFTEQAYYLKNLCLVSSSFFFFFDVFYELLPQRLFLCFFFSLFCLNDGFGLDILLCLQLLMLTW